MSDWNEELMELEKRDNLTGCQSVGAERCDVLEPWDTRWEIERLQKIIANKDAEIGALRFDRAMLKAEVNALRGFKNETI